jgi:co-chaperonin GroES (HSP10)
MNLTALQDCLIVEPDLEKHELFLLLRQKQTGFGTVLAAGPDAKDIRVGDKVCFGDSIGQEFSHENTQYLVMREAHVLGVLEA